MKHADQCPCGTEKTYQDCCEPFHKGMSNPPTPEALMRSRYSAYVKAQEPYLKATLLPESRKDYDPEAVREWSKKSEWLGLTIDSAQGSKVEFTAKYKTDGKILEHHEVSTFKKVGDRWFFVSGDSHVHEEGQGHHHTPMVPIKRDSEKLGRNDPCHCGSGKKLKKCCG
jgi:SEC-C motif-containing protein